MLKKLIILISIFAAIGFTVWFFFFRENNQTVSYKTAKVERGHIESGFQQPAQSILSLLFRWAARFPGQSRICMQISIPK